MMRLWCVWMLLACAACTRIDVAAMFESYQWEKRVLVVLAPERSAAALKAQMAVIHTEAAALKERDFVVWVLIANQSVMVDGEAKPHLFTPPFYAHFKADEKDFTVLMLGKDGDEKLREHSAVDATRLREVVDAMPMRTREILTKH